MLNEKVKTFRNIILNNAQSEEVSDEEIVGDFANIKQKIHSIARKKILKTEAVDIPLGPCPYPEIEYYNLIWKRFPGKDRLNILRAVLFHVLSVLILDNELFGNEGPRNFVSPGTSENNPSEADLAVFERAMRARKGGFANGRFEVPVVLTTYSPTARSSRLEAFHNQVH